MRRPSIQGAITAGVVLACAAFVLSRLEPSLVFANTTPAGGDMGAQVWAPAYLRDHLLPHGRISGWAPDWYAGFPAYTFYFPLPGLLIVLLDLLMPYGVAFKLVAVLGAVALPVAAYLFGRLSGLRFPGPPLLAIATLPFLFDTGFTIYGGNIPSILAGEFAFSISLSLALVFLGVMARGLETGRHRALAATLLALTALSHLIPTLFAIGAAGVLLLMRFDRRRLRYVAVVGLLGFMLAAFWALPLLARLPFSNDMGWGKITEYLRTLFPPHIKWMIPVAGAGVIAAVGLRLYSGIAIAAMGALAGLGFVFMPEVRLWNARLLPFWFLCLYLLAGVGLAELGRSLGGMITRDPDRPARWPALITPVAALVAGMVLVGGPLRALPDWLPIRSGQSSYVPDWVKWNFSGYERKADYPEYRALIQTMRRLPCGRAMWEYEPEINRYGTPMALMMLPYWTKGCTASMEGLYFEASATTPFHFVNASEVSKRPSNPMRDLPYQSLNISMGIKHLQLFGVRYYLATSPEAKAQAEADPDLRKVAISGPWEVFEIADADLVAPLSYEPVVVRGIGDAQKAWLPAALTFYMNPDRWDIFLAREGPREWARVNAEESPSRSAVPAAAVSNIRSDDDSVSFDVDRPGSPILVKISYFPNWKARGARGPWRVAPNLMVVVPTDRHVELRYGYTPVDVAGWMLFLLGLAGLFWVARRPMTFADPTTRVGESVEEEQEEDSLSEAGHHPLAIRASRGPPPEISVVMPAHNEQEILEASVREVVSALRDRGRPFELIIVENGSRDGTRQLAERLSAEIPEVQVGSLQMPDYGLALRAGLLAAAGEFVFNFDTDYYDLEFMDRALPLLTGDEASMIVVGSKRTAGARDARPWPRRLATSVFSIALRIGLGLRVSDTHGIKGMRRVPLLPLAERCRFGTDLFDTELILRAERSGLRVSEIPVTVEEKRPSRTSILRRALRTAVGVVRLRIAFWRERAPFAEEIDASRTARIGLLILILLYVVLLSRWTVTNHHGFGTSSFDLGIFDQGVWLLSRFREPFVTVVGLNLFGDHTSFILLLLVPFYWIFPSPDVLLVAQSVALGAGAVPVFLIARKVLSNERLALLIAIAYLAHPALGWTNFEQFHPDAFEVPLILFAVYFMIRHRWFGFLASVGAALLVKEDVALLTFVLGLYVAVRHNRKIGLWTAGVSAAWFVAILFWILPAFNQVGTLDAWRVPASQFGGGGGLIKTALFRPWKLVAYALGPGKPFYLWQLFAPFALLSLLSPGMLVVVIGPLLSNLLSTFWYQYHIQYHYTTLIVPVLVSAAVFGVARFRSPSVRGLLVAVMTVSALVTAYLWGPMGRHPGYVGDPSTPHAAAMREMLHMIPSEAAVSSYHSFVPHLTHRKYIFDFPNPWRAGNWADFSKEGQELPYIHLIDYVLALEETTPENKVILSRLLAGEFERIHDAEGYILLKRRSAP